jgi:hypothetical protein
MNGCINSNAQLQAPTPFLTHKPLSMLTRTWSVDFPQPMAAYVATYLETPAETSKPGVSLF